MKPEPEGTETVFVVWSPPEGILDAKELVKPADRLEENRMEYI